MELSRLGLSVSFHSVGFEKSFKFAVQAIVLLKSTPDFSARQGLIGFVPGDRELVHSQCSRHLSLAQRASEPEIAEPITKGPRRNEVVVYIAPEVWEKLFKPSAQCRQDTPQHSRLNDLHFIAFQFCYGVMA